MNAPPVPKLAPDPPQILHLPQSRVQVQYTNYRGETTFRVITPLHFFWSEGNQYHPEPQWVLQCYDHERERVLTLAMKGINQWRGVPS